MFQDKLAFPVGWIVFICPLTKRNILKKIELPKCKNGSLNFGHNLIQKREHIKVKNMHVNHRGLDFTFFNILEEKTIVRQRKIVVCLRRVWRSLPIQKSIVVEVSLLTG